ncbi:DNA helicase [Tanacetum coccineum]|uniref:DNA helicase n=1 Tax=Tanacetum coccineum TaxID=301880 RepID=A0ABQ5APA7_9ASTR
MATRDSYLGHVGEGRFVLSCQCGGQCQSYLTCSWIQSNRRRRSIRDNTTTYGNVDGSDRSLSKRQHISVDHSNPYLATPDANFVLAGGPVPNVGNSSGVHVSSESNLRHESVASSYINKKRTRDVMSRTTTPNVGSSFTPTRRRVSSGHHSLNTSTLNDDPVFPVNSSNMHTNGFRFRENRTGPPLEYKHIGKCEHSGEHCRVVLRTYQIYPQYIQLLLQDRHFMENIRAYNQMFTITSLGARVDDSINIGQGPYVFKISGQLYHWLGSLCPAEGDPPRILQLYVYDTENEINNRMSHFGGNNSDLRRDIVEGLIEFLDDHNALVRLFRTAREKLLDSEGEIVYEPGPDTDMDFDIIIKQRIGLPQRVNKLHLSYMALQFPLLFVYGEDGYSKYMKMVRVPGASSDEDRRLTTKAYYSYVLHDRVNSFNYLSKTERLFQQYMVIAFCAVEQSRIDYILEHQNDIRNEYLSGIYDTIRRGDNDGSDCGGRLILPQSFTGGPRYMYAHYLDALANCCVHGNPSYFITFTCNVKWPEIVEYMVDFPGVTTADRADIVDNVFEMKIHQFVKYLRDIKPFGKIIAIVYTVEFQKRGLPHCHTLIWVDKNSRIQSQEDIDNHISAELPSEEADPEGHRVVAEFMIHGPCGEVCPMAACMKNDPKCTKHFPKEYCHNTYTDADRFVHYRRRDTRITTTKKNVELDNGYVVPYNRQLLKTFYAHINVEHYGWTMLIKYLFKYISKGTDKIVARVTRNDARNNASTPSSSSQPKIVIDEIKNYLDSRYIGPHEACWRLFEFDIHFREPAVQVLAVHGENMQRVVFRETDQLQSVADNPHKKTTLTEWLD